MLALAAVAAFLVTRSNVNNQNRRLLRERTGEVALLLQSAVGNLPTSLQPLGVAQRLGGTAAFLKAADARTLSAPTQTVALVRNIGGTPTVVTMAGLAPVFPKGATLTGVPARAIASAAAGELTATSVFRFGQTKLVGFAIGPPTTAPGTSILLVAPIDPRPTATHRVTQQRPFDELDAALYAAAARRPVPARADDDEGAAHQPGGERPHSGGRRAWLLVARARDSLSGSFATAVPWIILAVGMLSAAVATAVLLVFLRRRDYALTLVDARTAQLNASLDELSDTQARLVFQERLAAIGQVAAAVGHELRNPLGVTSNSLYLIRTALPSGDTERIERHLATARPRDRRRGRDRRRVARLRPPERSPVPRRSTSTTSWTSRSASPCHRPRDRSGAARADEVGRVRADRQQLRQVLLNLLTNAYAAMDGRGTLTIEAVPAQTASRSTVADTGTGIGRGHGEPHLRSVLHPEGRRASASAWR